MTGACTVVRYYMAGLALIDDPTHFEEVRVGTYLTTSVPPKVAPLLRDKVVFG